MRLVLRKTVGFIRQLRYFHFTNREMQGQMSINRKNFLGGVAIFFAVSAVFTFLGVYDSNKMPLMQGFFYWSATIGTGAVMGLLIFSWIFKGPLRYCSILLKLVVLSGISSLPVVIVLAAYSGGLSGEWPASNWLIQYVLTFPITLLINGVGYLALKATGVLPHISGLSNDNELLTEHFMKRLSVKYRNAELYAVSSEDHYIRVHTDAGEELILMRLSDALAELIGVDGLQTHRSWWVAKKGIADSQVTRGKHRLILKSGSAAPVSRSFLKSVRDAGVL